MKRRLHRQKQPVRGSGDFLKDMGYADPDEMRVKFTLANAIALAIEDHALTQDDAAKITGLAQSDVLRIVNGVVKEYAVFRLMRALAALGKDILIEISNSASEQGMIVARPSDANDAAVAGYIVQVRDRREPPFVTVQFEGEITPRHKSGKTAEKSQGRPYRPCSSKRMKNVRTIAATVASRSCNTIRIWRCVSFGSRIISRSSMPNAALRYLPAGAKTWLRRRTNTNASRHPFEHQETAGGARAANRGQVGLGLSV